MRRFTAWLLIAHAIGHAYLGTWVLDQRSALGFLVWAIVVIGYGAAGLGLLRVPFLRNHWRGLALTGAYTSVALCAWASALWVIPGLAIDVAVLVVVLGATHRRFDADIEVVNAVGTASYRHPLAVKVGWSLGAIAFAYGAAVVLLRPVFVRWGTSAIEREAALPGDEVFPRFANYRIDHAITIHAPVSAVWPWLVQLGQDRGGFYSYDWLERGAGADIRNTDRIHPEWQTLALGDTVFATQRSYFGGRLGGLGWRVNVFEPERVIGLENWGTFVLRPIDSATTRLIVRTRGDSPPRIASIVLAPVNVFVFEPAHFLMERAMLRGIRDRAERQRADVASTDR